MILLHYFHRTVTLIKMKRLLTSKKYSGIIGSASLSSVTLFWSSFSVTLSDIYMTKTERDVERHLI